MRLERARRRPGPVGRDGQAMVEFALALPLLMALVFAIVQLAILVNIQQTLSHVATAAALVGRESNRSFQMKEAAKQYIGPVAQIYESAQLQEMTCPPGGPGQVVLCIYENVIDCPSPEGPGQMTLCIAPAPAVGTPLKVTIRYNAPLLVSLFGFGGVPLSAQGVAYWGA